MKAAKIFNIKRIKNKFLFLSLLLCTFSCFAKGEPEWFLNWRTVYPNEKYIAQRGSGENAEKVRTDALSQIARYFQTTVNANLTTTMQSVTSENSVSEKTTVIDEVSVLSQVELFAVEYTEGYYYKKEKKWYSVASHIAEVLIEDNAEGSEPVSIIPAISLKLTGKETGQTVFSFEAESKEKTVSYTLENAKKKAYLKLAGELKAVIKNNLGTAFAL